MFIACTYGLFNGDFISDINMRLSREIGDLLICKLENVLLMQSVHLHIDSVDRAKKRPPRNAEGKNPFKASGMKFKFLRLHLKFVDVVSKENKNLH